MSVRTVYGIGGFDPSKPNDNIVEQIELPDPEPTEAEVDVPDMGFVAQDLLQVMEDTGIDVPNLVSQDNPDKLEAAYGTLIPILVQAIKELSAKVEALEERN